MSEVRDPITPEGGLSAASARAVLWSAGQKWVLRIGGFVTVTILARLLSPADFGLVALAMTVIPFLYLLTDLGFTGGGKGAGMVYVAGRPDQKVDNAAMIDHIVGLVEERARTLRAEAKG